MEEPQQEKNDQPQVETSSMGEEEGPILIVRNWFECKREDSVLLKVNVENKSNGKIKFKVRFEHADDVPSNLKLPASAIK